jgi:hypothetical protein
MVIVRIRRAVASVYLIDRKVTRSAFLRTQGSPVPYWMKVQIAPLRWPGSTHNMISNQFERIGARRKCRETLLGACAADADVWAALDEWLKGPPVATSHPILNSDRFNIVASQWRLAWALSRRDCDRRRNAERRGIAIYRLDARRAARRFDQVISGRTRRFLVRYPPEFGATELQGFTTRSKL